MILSKLHNISLTFQNFLNISRQSDSNKLMTRLLNMYHKCFQKQLKLHIEKIESRTSNLEEEKKILTINKNCMKINN